MEVVGVVAASSVVGSDVGCDGASEKVPESISVSLNKLDDKSQIKDAVRMAEVITTLHFNLCCASVLHKMSGLSAKALVVLPCYVSLEVGQFVIAKLFVFEELLERARETEEKEAKKRKRLADEFYELIHASKEITTSSKWEDCKSLFGDRQVASFAFIDLELVT
ncbi:hypothetical protein FXO37_09253 [Capsicum annuum]|nr:hypothetical protein FXO37_09253 [Capsicum annuum]